jgi:phosphatidylglycerol:prolipoprotein diacylglycerol transferase
VPVHPVQAYAALSFAVLVAVLLAWLPRRRQTGDIAGICLLGTGSALYLTEFWRDTEGRGSILGGALDGPQLAAIALVLLGALVLKQRNSHHGSGTLAPDAPPHQQNHSTTEAAIV